MDQTLEILRYLIWSIEHGKPVDIEAAIAGARNNFGEDFGLTIPEEEATRCQP